MKYYEWLCIPKVKAMSIFIVHILFFTFINLLSFHLIGRKTEEEGGNKETLYLSFHLSNSCKCWSWAKLKSATRNDATQNDTGVSPLGRLDPGTAVIVCCLPGRPFVGVEDLGLEPGPRLRLADHLVRTQPQCQKPAPKPTLCSLS